MRPARTLAGGVVAALLAATVPGLAAPTPVAATGPLEAIWSIADGVASTGSYVTGSGGGGTTLAVQLADAPEAQGAPVVMAAVAAESSQTEAPGEWAMGGRNLARTGNAAWEEFLSVPLRTDWTAEAGDKVQVNPAVVDDIAYFGGAGVDRTVYAVDLQDGDQVEWSVTIDGSVLSAPAVTEEWVYFGGADGRLYRVSAGRQVDGGGQRSWSFPAEGAAPVGAIIGGPAVTGGVVYFGAADGKVYAVDADTGQPAWSQPGVTPERISSSVTVAGGMVIATSGANEWVTAFDAADGTQLWQRQLYTWENPDTLGSAVSVSGSKVFLTGLDERLYVLDQASGDDVVPPATLAGRAQTTPVLAAERVFLGTNNGRVQAFDRGGLPQWNVTVPGGGIVREPVFASGLLFASSTSGSLHVLDADDGSLQWSFVAGPMFAAPAVVSNHVLVGSDDGNLYGLEPGLPDNQTATGQPFGHYGPGQHPYQHYESDPVSTTTGNLLEQRADIVATGGAGIPVSFTRTYNSLSAGTDGPLGHGWTHNLNVELQPATDPTIVWGDGRHDLYTGTGAGTYASPPDVDAELRSDASGYTLTGGDETVFRFDTAGALVSVTDPSGNVTTLSHAGGRLSSVTDPAGRTIGFGYDAAGRIATATDPVGQVWRYRYQDGDLVEVENPAGEVWRYTYDAHRIVTVTDPDGDLLLRNTYVGTSGKVATQADGEGHTWTFDYQSDHTRVTDPTGVSYRSYFDANHRTVRIVDDVGHETRSVFDAAGNLVAVVDAAGLETRYAYDDEGNLTAALDPTGHKTAFSYDDEANLTAVTDLKGNTTRYTHDEAGRPVTITTPTGQTTTVAYRPDGQVDAVTDAAGATSRYGYDAAGLLTSVTDPLGRTTAMDLRADGRARSVTNPAAETVAYAYDLANRVESMTDPLGRTTTFDHDGRGMRTQVTDPRGHTTTYAYDARGLLTSVTDALGRVTSFGYDAARRPTTRTDARGVTISRSYDELGRLRAVDLPDQADTSFTYDAAGRIATITDGTGTTTFTYDDYGRLVGEQRGVADASLSYRYDIMGRRSAMELRRGPILAARNTYDYDAAGRILSVTDTTGGETDFGYDAAGRLATVDHANGSRTSYTFDPAGQIARVLNLPEGLLDLRGDADSPLQATTDTLASLHGLGSELSEPANVTALAGIVAELQDLAANLAAGGADLPTLGQLLADLADTTAALDAAVGELLDAETLAQLETLVADLGENVASLPQSAAADQATDLAEDLAVLTSELTATTTGLSDELDLLGDLLVDVLRLASGLLLGQADLNPTLDTIGELAGTLPGALERIDADIEALAAVLTDLTGAGGGLQSEWAYMHDPAGRTSQATRRFVTARNELLTFTNTYGYDAAGQLLSATTTDPAVLVGGNVGYAYDEAGNRTQVTVGGALPIDYTYDAANQLTGDMLHAYTHDASGNLTSRAPLEQANLATTYTWDSLHRLVGIADAAGTVVDHTYDHGGRRVATTTTDPAGSTTTDTYLYDGWDLLNHVGERGDTAYTTVDGRVLAATTATGDVHLHPDATGNVGEVTDDRGNVVVRNAYTPYGETTSVPGAVAPDGAATQFGYSGTWGVRDAAGGLLDMRNRMYDPTLGQFLSRDPLEASTGDAYGYGGGNPVDGIDPYGLCNIGPVRIGFLSNDDGGCRGAGTLRQGVEIVGWVADGALVACGGATLVVPNPYTATCAGIAAGVGRATDIIQVADNCAIRNVAADCAGSLVGFTFGEAMDAIGGPDVARYLAQVNGIVFDHAIGAFVDRAGQVVPDPTAYLPPSSPTQPAPPAPQPATTATIEIHLTIRFGGK